MSEKDLVEWLIVVNPGLHSAHKVLVGKGCKLVCCQIRKEETDVKEAAPYKDNVTQKNIVRLFIPNLSHGMQQIIT